MKRAPWLYTLMQIALWSIHGVLISYAQRYLAGMGMRDSAIGLLLGGATAAGFVLPEHHVVPGGVQRTALTGETVGFQCFPIHKLGILSQTK